MRKGGQFLFSMHLTPSVAPGNHLLPGGKTEDERKKQERASNPGPTVCPGNTSITILVAREPSLK